MTLWKSSQLNLPYLISRRNVINIETRFSLRQFYDIPRIIRDANLNHSNYWATSVEWNKYFTRETQSFAEFIFRVERFCAKFRGRNNARRKRGRWCNFCPRVLNIRAKLFCKSKLAARKSGWTSAFLWPSRHGPGVKLLLVAASLLALMLPRETVYISCTKARMSVMPRPI